MTQSHSEPAGSPFTPEMLDALVSGLGSARSMAIFIAWVGRRPAVLRDEASALTLVEGTPIDMRAMIWRACGFRPVVPGGQVPPWLRDDWVVRVRGDRVVAVDTQFGAAAATLGCDWITESPSDGVEVLSDGAVPGDWLDEARRLGGVMLVSADLGLDPQASDVEVMRVLAAVAASGRLLAGLARLDHQP